MALLLDQCIAIACSAGAAVMDIYESEDIGLTFKNDKSPLTKADMTAHKIIEKGLKKIAQYPVLSEEGNRDAAGNDCFWLVDPVDGTKEFIKHNGEFTINIGLVKSGRPVLGVVYAPALGLLYAGTEKEGSFKIDQKGTEKQINATFKNKIPIVAISRSHINVETEKFLTALGQHKLTRLGSSLKLCFVAEGKAYVYPRLGPTYLWDTAAGDAILRAAGGKIENLAGAELIYELENLINPYFIAKAANYLKSI